jgi:hypothetical protein
VPMLMQHDSLVGKRAFFATKHLFVTPHEDNQLFPSGDHVVQSEECLGLKQWTKEVRGYQLAAGEQESMGATWAASLKAQWAPGCSVAAAFAVCVLCLLRLPLSHQCVCVFAPCLFVLYTCRTAPWLMLTQSSGTLLGSHTCRG